MSNRNHANRDRQPEWNAPLVSLPDITQIINGDSDVTQPIAVSMSENGPAGPCSDATEPVLATAKQVSGSKDLDASPEKTPILAVAQRSAMPSAPTQQDSLPIDGQVESPDAGAAPTAEERSNPETVQTANHAGQRVKQLWKQIMSKAPVGGERSTMWKNLLICAGSVAATVAILAAFSGETNDRNAKMESDRSPLHDEPLEDATANDPVAEFADLEPAPQSSVAVVESPNDAEKIAIASAEELQQQADEWSAVATRSDALTTDSPAPQQPQFAEESADHPHDMFTADEGDSNATSATAEQNEYRHIQRYQPEPNPSLQPPANSPHSVQNATAPQSKSFYNDTVSAVRQSGERETRAENDEPYYERTSPDRYQWPEDANDRAIEFLSKRVRR